MMRFITISIILMAGMMVLSRDSAGPVPYVPTMVTYDSTFMGQPVRITRRTDLFSGNFQSVGAVYHPGLGEVPSSSVSTTVRNGPHDWMDDPGATFTGVIQLGNGPFYNLVLISINRNWDYPTGTTQMATMDELMSGLVSHFNMVDLNLTGISAGGWFAHKYAAAYPHKVNSIVSVMGVNANASITQLATWASDYGGKELNFENLNDTRGGDQIVNAMNAAVPGSAIYFKTKLGEPAPYGHDSYKLVYNPTRATWAHNATDVNNTIPASQIVYSDVLTWMVRQSDTTIGSAGSSNIPPTVDVGSDQTLTFPDNDVSVTATAADADGTIASYYWEKISGPFSYAITDNDGASTDITGMETGVYVFRCTVTDDDGATSYDEITITINDPEDEPLVVTAFKDTTLAWVQTNSWGLTTLLPLYATASEAVDEWHWEVIEGTASDITFSTPDNDSTNAEGFQPGIYRFRVNALTATKSGSDTITIRVVNYNEKGQCPCREGPPEVHVIGATNQIFIPYMRRSGYDIQGGDTIKINPASNEYGIYNGINIGDFGGKPECPVIIVPNGAPVYIGALPSAPTFTSFFRLGNGTGDTCFVSDIVVDGTYLRWKGYPYGFLHIDPTPSDGAIGITGNLLRNFEFKGIYLQGVGSGFEVKLNSDSTRPWRLAYRFDHGTGIIHDNFISNNRNETTYIGNSYPDSGEEHDNDGASVRGLAVYIYNNIVDSSGWDGLQVSNWQYAEIHNNVLLTTGTKNNAVQRSAAGIGGNTTGYFKNNIVYNGHDGFTSTGFGRIIFERNYFQLVDNRGNGASANHILFAPRPTGPGTDVLETRDSGHAYVFNNIFNKPQGYAFWGKNTVGAASKGMVTGNYVIESGSRDLDDVLVTAADDTIENNILYTEPFDPVIERIGNATDGVFIRVTVGIYTADFYPSDTIGSEIFDWIKLRMLGVRPAVLSVPQGTRLRRKPG